MALEDPFFVVKDEVLKALLKTRDLFESWRMGDEGRDLRSAEEQEWATTELRNSLRSIEWDLEDLDDTVQIVEKNPAKFRIDASELAVRKAFIQQTRDEVNQMKDRTNNTNPAAAADGSSSRNLEPSLDTIPLASPSSPVAAAAAGHPSSLMSHSSSSHGLRQHPQQRQHNGGGVSGGIKSAVGGSVPGLGTKYSRLPSEADSPGHASTGAATAAASSNGGGVFSSTSQMIQHQQLQQERLLSQQDDRLQIMSDSVGTLRNVSGQIGNELDEQAVMLDEFGTEIENAESKLDATMRKMAKVLHMANDRRQWMAIGALSSAMVVIIIMLFAL